ncbi:MAG: acyl carrier protein [Phycisphaerae bacterium]|nr:acyl carrier protein [Phycisphaerae bacterium]
MSPEEIKSTVRTHILAEFLPGEDPAALTDSTPLVSTGILDSIAVLGLVTYLESKFGITLEAHETDAQHLNTLTDIARLVQSKLSAA